MKSILIISVILNMAIYTFGQQQYQQLYSDNVINPYIVTKTREQFVDYMYRYLAYANVEPTIAIPNILKEVGAYFDLWKTRENLEQQLNSFAQHYSELDANYGKTLAKMDDLYKTTIPNVENKLNEFTNYFNSFRQYRESLETKINNLQVQDQTDGSTDLLKKDLSNLSQEVAKLDSGMLDAFEGIEGLKELQSQINSGLNTQLSENQKMAKLLNDLVDESKTVIHEKEELIKENLLLRQELESLRGIGDELKSLKQVVKDVQTECMNGNLDAQVGSLKQIAQNNTEELMNLKLSVSSIEQDLNKRLEELADMQKTAEGLKTSLKEMTIPGNVTTDASTKDLEDKVNLIHDYYNNQTQSNTELINEISNNLDNLNNELQKLKLQVNSGIKQSKTHKVYKNRF